MKDPLVSIIIPTYNRKMMAIRLIQSILAGTYKNIEIIVIDDVSTDGTYTTLRNKYANNHRISLLKNAAHAFTAGSRNKGMKKAIGKYIFFIDDDNVLDSCAIREMVQVFENDNTIGELGPVNYSFSHKHTLLWTCTKRNMKTTMTQQPRSLAEFGARKLWKTVDVPNAFMVRASVIKQFAITFDPIFEIMYEESDFAYRIQKSGYGVYVLRTAKIYHDIENGMQGAQKLNYMHHFMTSTRRTYVFGRNRILFHTKYSEKKDMFGILAFWIWVFAFYYAYKISSYSGVGKFTIIRRAQLVLEYVHGTLDGMRQFSEAKVVGETL